MKPNHVNGVPYKFGDQIIKVDDERETALGIISDINNLDMKYELFCKWLHQNDQGSMFCEDRKQNSNALLTEDEVSSFTTNSDDSDSDIFLDPESDFPVIVLSNDDNEQAPQTVDRKLNGDGKFRVDTPSQLSVSDFDCSSSDITVSSMFSGSSSQMAKRKAKHKKGRAPPIPIIKSTQNQCNEFLDIATNNDDPFISHNLPCSAQSARETDI